MGRFWSKFRNGNFKIFDLSHQTVKKSFLVVSNWLGMLNNIYLSTLYKNILPNPDFRAHFGTKIFVPKCAFHPIIAPNTSQNYFKLLFDAFIHCTMVCNGLGAIWANLSKYVALTGEHSSYSFKLAWTGNTNYIT